MRELPTVYSSSRPNTDTELNRRMFGEDVTGLVRIIIASAKVKQNLTESPLAKLEQNLTEKLLAKMEQNLTEE